MKIKKSLGILGYFWKKNEKIKEVFFKAEKKKNEKIMKIKKSLGIFLYICKKNEKTKKQKKR